MNQVNEFVTLENALVRAGGALEYPATPPIAARVRTELARDVSPRALTPPRNWARIFVSLAAALILALALLFAIPNARDAVAQFLGLRGLRIFYMTPTPTAAPTMTPRATDISARTAHTPTPRATPTLTIKPFTLCCETTLADAQKRARYTLLAPPNETPSQVYYQNVFNNGEQVVMVFGDVEHPRFTLYQAQRWIYGKLVDTQESGKQPKTQTLIGKVQVNGTRALWFSGAPHVVMMLDARGEPIYETQRVVDANTLVWETGNEYDGIIYRLETKLPLNQAVQIAETLVEYKP